MEVNWGLVKVLIAGILFVLLGVVQKKRIKNLLLWALIGYLIYLGVSA